MATYTPPVREMKFLLDNICGLDEIVTFPDFAHVDVDLAYSALDEAARFFAEVVAPTYRDGDLIGAVHNQDGTVAVPPSFREAYEQFVAAGWGAVKSPTAYGGHGFPGTISLAILEMLTSANMALSLCPMLTASAVLAIQEHGSKQQKSDYLKKLISGEWTGTMVLTEPGAGSDVGALTTQATPNRDDSWAITGTKIFITWGEHDMAENIIHLVLARTPNAPQGTKGISLFIVPKFVLNAEGDPADPNSLHCVSIERKLGIHGSPTCVMAFEGATGFLVGEENRGMAYMFTMMNDARVHVGLEGTGLAERSYQQARAYAADRLQGRVAGTPKTESSAIVEHPDVRRMLLTMRANIEGSRALLYDTAAALDRSRHHPDAAARAAADERVQLLTPIAKGFCTDLSVELTSMGVQIHGGMGFIEETGSAQMMRDTRITPIYEGTNGIQAIDLVSRKLPIRSGEAIGDLFNEIENSANQLDGSLNAIGEQLRSANESARKATEYLLAHHNTKDALAGATPYLRMLGLLLGGHYLARQAAIAVSQPEDTWLRDKIVVASFYAEQLLPAIHGLTPAVTAGADQLYGINP